MVQDWISIRQQKNEISITEYSRIETGVDKLDNTIFDKIVQAFGRNEEQI